MSRWINKTLAVFLCSSSFAYAEPNDCSKNFLVEGNFVTGKTYKTEALLSGINSTEAFARVAQFTIQNGFTILSSDKQAGFLSAAQSVSYSQGKKVIPLNISILPDADNSGTLVKISFATSLGSFSKEEDVKRHFCETILAAATKSSSRAISNYDARRQDTVLPSNAPVELAGIAVITPRQQELIDKEIGKAVPNNKGIALAVSDSKPVIASFLQKMACVSEYGSTNLLNEFAAPGVDFSSFAWGYAPIRQAVRHNKASCMTVTRVHGWNIPNNNQNALRFEAVYKSDGSGETIKVAHEAIRQPDGVWLFSR